MFRLAKLSLFCSLLLLSIAAKAEWVQKYRHANVLYALSDTTNQIFRYSLETSSELPAINLSARPYALSVDDDGIYISYGRYIVKTDLDGANEQHLQNTNTDVMDVDTDGNLLLFPENGVLKILDKTSGTTLGSSGYYYGTTGRSVSTAKASNKWYGRRGSSPTDVVYTQYGDDGTIITSGDSPYHGDYPIGQKTYIFPDETIVLTSVGTMFDADSLTYTGSLGETFEDVSFWQGSPVLLSQGRVLTYNSGLLNSGVAQVSSQAVFLEVHNDNVYVFIPSASGLDVEIIATADITPEQPGEAVDPNGLPYDINDLVVASDEDRVFVLNAATKSIFQWSISQNSYLDTIPLLRVPKVFAYSADLNRLYVGYASGLITKIELDNGFAEEPFAALPNEVGAIQAAGPILYASTRNYRGGNYTFLADGTQADLDDYNYSSTAYTWSPVNQRMLGFRTGVSPNDLIWSSINIVTGEIVSSGDSPYHSSSYWRFPIRVSPDGQSIIVGTGKIFDGTTLSQIDTLPHQIIDAGWSTNGDLYSIIEESNGFSELTQWDSVYAPIDSISIPGSPLALRIINDIPLFVVEKDGIPGFYYFSLDNLPDSDGDTVSDFEDNCPDAPNTSQENTDNDFQGNECDMDDDGDGMPDDFEIAQGLDPLNSSDAVLDSDGDGYTNAREYAVGTDLNDPDDHPVALTLFQEDFETALIPATWRNSATADAGWEIVNESADTGSYSLASGSIGNSQAATIVWHDEFKAGTLEFDAKVDSEGCCDRLQIYIDGVYTQQVSSYSPGWQHVKFTIPEGEHLIEFRYVKDGSASSGEDRAWIDNILYYQGFTDPFQDTDLDSVPDYLDNCDSVPNGPNESDNQGDLDADQIGDACDIWNSNNLGILDASSWYPLGSNSYWAYESTQDPDTLLEIVRKNYLVNGLVSSADMVTNETLIFDWQVDLNAVSLKGVEYLTDYGREDVFIDDLPVLQLGQLVDVPVYSSGLISVKMPNYGSGPLINQSELFEIVETMFFATSTIRGQVNLDTAAGNVDALVVDLTVNYTLPAPYYSSAGFSEQYYFAEGIGLVAIAEYGSLPEQDKFILSAVGMDSDGDSVLDPDDLFPNDPNESRDSDGDGVGDNIDAFPFDANESVDSDGDSVGDNSDAFPQNSTETVDSDGDGVGDNADEFPNNPTETNDSDGDGVGDSADAFPLSGSETHDSDGDGVGNNSDAFPFNPSETHDSDGDGVGDNSDAYPNNANASKVKSSSGGGSLPLILLGLLFGLVFYRSRGLAFVNVSLKSG